VSVPNVRVSAQAERLLDAHTQTRFRADLLDDEHPTQSIQTLA
jgi:hypothetical protein